MASEIDLRVWKPLPWVAGYAKCIDRNHNLRLMQLSVIRYF